VLTAISEALNLSAETLLAGAGMIDAMAGSSPDGKRAGPRLAAPGTKDAIRAGRRLSEDQQDAPIAVYLGLPG